MNKKKEIERHQVTKFLSNNEQAFVINSIENSETPDFILGVGDKKVSLEHTRLTKPELKKVESYREKIIENARVRFREKYNDELYVLITFNNIKLESGKVAFEKYVNEVLQIIEEVYIVNRLYKFDISSDFINRPFSKLVDSFSVSNTWKFENWQHFGAYIVDRIDRDWLKSMILKKDINIERYSQKFDENWLLLVADFEGKSSSHNIFENDILGIETRFDKVFIYSYMPDCIMVVK